MAVLFCEEGGMTMIIDLLKKFKGGPLPVDAAREGENIPGERMDAEKPVTISELTQAVERGVMLVVDEGRRRSRRRVAIMVLMIACAVTLFASVGGTPALVDADSDPVAVLPLTGKSGTAHVAIIPIEGEIDGDILGPSVFANTTLYIHDALALVEENENTVAVILYINSPGGGAVASAQGYRLIKQFKERTKIPVYAYVSSYAYSGGYYLALGGDKIIVDPEASIGNIGVIMRLFNTSRLGEWVGVTEEEISTGPRKNTGSQWKKLSPGDRAMLQREVDQTFMRFMKAISESRHIPLATLIAESHEDMGRTSGAWFSPADAIANKLADKEQTVNQLFHDIAHDAATKKDWEKVEFIRYDKRIEMLDRWKSEVMKALQGVLVGRSFPSSGLRAE